MKPGRIHLSARLIGVALAAAAVGACTSTSADNDNSDPADAHHLIYLHGRIIEDQGLPAISPRYGEYRFQEIVDTFRNEGFVVHAEIRKAGADPQIAARKTVAQITRLLENGVPIDNITVVGASKGAFIAALTSDLVAENRLRFVLLAGCSDGVVEHLLERDMRLHGRILTIRDALDTSLAGSCEAVVETSPGVELFREIVVETGLEHGLIYGPQEAWVTPVLEFAREERND